MLSFMGKAASIKARNLRNRNSGVIAKGFIRKVEFD